MCKKCKIEGCNNEAMDKRRYCREHYLERKREQFNVRRQSGEYTRTMYDRVCIVCGKEYRAWKKSSKFCSVLCANSSVNPAGKNNYVYNKGAYQDGIWAHRTIAKKVLARELNTNEVVHHVDLNPKNNDLDNLIVMTRGKHAALHRFLSAQGATLKRLSGVNIENCWDTWARETTTTWLETANVKVIKLSQYRQSAAELRLGEGSETMRDAPQVGDDIVQTTTP